MPNEMDLRVGFAFGLLAIGKRALAYINVSYVLISIYVVSILPPRFWWQQISWSYCAASRTFGLMP